MLLMRLLLTLVFSFFFINAFAQMSDSIKVLFIYGSKPAREFKNTEHRWFGGVRGGHVAIQIGPDKVLSFRSTKYNPCHILSARHSAKYASVFEIRTVHATWEIFPPHNYIIDSLKRAEVVIPIDSTQRARIDSITKAYTKQAPYDYAVFGMRCASSSYEVLGQIGGIVSTHKHLDWLRVFTVKNLRTLLFKKAEKNKDKGWIKRIYPGSSKRIWEKDW
jgi:hypothetical protein